MFKYLVNFFIFSLWFSLENFMLDIIDTPKVKPISSLDSFIIEYCTCLQNAKVQTCVINAACTRYKNKHMCHILKHITSKIFHSLVSSSPSACCELNVNPKDKQKLAKKNIGYASTCLGLLKYFFHDSILLLTALIVLKLQII